MGYKIISEAWKKGKKLDKDRIDEIDKETSDLKTLEDIEENLQKRLEEVAYAPPDSEQKSAFAFAAEGVECDIESGSLGFTGRDEGVSVALLEDGLSGYGADAGGHVYLARGSAVDGVVTFQVAGYGLAPALVLAHSVYRGVQEGGVVSGLADAAGSGLFGGNEGSCAWSGAFTLSLN